ncbi:sesquipedalian-1-like [Oppia nitens]|uniref:sesquipedalian-1-like n=1 Tax=Oppia nitens TaxID=1686743 RepID=UPI0023DC611A|nr:sesquipedalian-1-like [Oppia nitens]
MKINERTLVQAVHSRQTPIDRCGWLYKRGEVNKSFQKRWCVLKGNLFYYFEKKTSSEPIGVIILEGCRIEVAEHETEMFAFNIDFGCDQQMSAQSQSSTQLRTYVFGTDSQQDMESWMKALSCASYDYLKMIVTELQTKLDDINQLKAKRQSRDCASSGQPAVRVNPFDNEGPDLLDLRSAQSSQSDTGMQFTRRAFAEIHEFYGLKFRDYIQQNKDKHKDESMTKH